MTFLTWHRDYRTNTPVSLCCLDNSSVTLSSFDFPSPERSSSCHIRFLFISAILWWQSQLCLPNIASHPPWELNSQCTLLQVGHILQCNAFTEQLRQTLACFVRWLQRLTAANEKTTSSADKVSDLGIELKLDSFSHMLSLSEVERVIFFPMSLLSCVSS